jgi:hypothetical protein
MGAFSAVRSSVSAPGLGLLLDVLLGDLNKFAKGYVFEVIDIRTGDQKMVKSLVLNPRRYTLTEPFAVTLTPTEDNSVVAEENGQIIREITIEGTTGLKKRKEEALGLGSQIGTDASGPEHFYQLRNFFREYSEMKKRPSGPFFQMIFHNVKEDDHFVVVPRAFETPRDASKDKMHFNYRITLAAIAVFPPPVPPLNIGEELFGAEFTKLAKGVADARSFFVETLDEIGNIKERFKNPESIFDSAADAINQSNGILENSVVGGQAQLALTLEVVAGIENMREALGLELVDTPGGRTIETERLLWQLEEKIKLAARRKARRSGLPTATKRTRARTSVRSAVREKRKFSRATPSTPSRTASAFPASRSSC